MSSPLFFKLLKEWNLPILLACVLGISAVVLWIKYNGGSIWISEADTQQAELISTNTEAWLQWIGTDVNKVVVRGQRITELMMESGNLDTNRVRLLLERGANPNLKDRLGRTSLIHAACVGDKATNVVQILVEHGADVNAKDYSGNTALDYAQANATNVARMLRQAGAKSK
jgi:hypothetical protein